MNWSDLQHLLALAHHQTLPKAAEALGVNRTTVSRRIEQLEVDLGVKLVEKVGRDLALTSAGHDAVAAAEVIDGELHGLERRVFGRDRQLAGVIKLTLTPGIGCLLAPYLAAFQSDYPEVTLDISVTNLAEDLELMESDIALRFTSRPPETLVGRKIGRPVTALYACRTLAENLPDLEEVEVISTHVTDLVADANIEKKVKKVIRTNSIDLAKELVAAGKGISHLPCYLVEGDARLVRVSGTREQVMPELWLLYHPRLRTQLRVRRFTDYLVQSFEELAPLMSGDE